MGKNVSFDEFMNARNQGDQLVVALFHAPNTEKSQWMVEKAKEIVPKSGAFLLLIDGNRYSQDLSKVCIDRDPTTIFYKDGTELCRMVGIVAEKVLVDRLSSHV